MKYDSVGKFNASKDLEQRDAVLRAALSAPIRLTDGTEVDEGAFNNPFGFAEASYDADGNLDEQSQIRRRSSIAGAMYALNNTDFDRLDEDHAWGMYRGIARNLLNGIEDKDASVMFPDPSTSGVANLKRLKQFLGGDNTAVMSEEAKAWSAMDDEQKYNYAIAHETSAQKVKDDIQGNRGGSWFMSLVAGAGASGGTQFGGTMPLNAAYGEQMRSLANEQRRMDIENLSPEERAEVMKRVIGEYEGRIYREHKYLALNAAIDKLSDANKSIVASVYNTGMFPQSLLAGMKEEDANKVISAVALLNGNRTEGRLFGVSTDVSRGNTVRRAAYNLQNSILGILPGIYDMSQDLFLTAYGYAGFVNDVHARDRYFDVLDRERRIKDALEGGLQEGDGIWESSWDVAAQQGDFMVSGFVGKLGKGLTAARLATGLADAEKAAKAATMAGDAESMVKALASATRLSRDLKEMSKVKRGLGSAIHFTGVAAFNQGFWDEHMQSCLDSGVRFEDAVLTGIAAVPLNSLIEVSGGLESRFFGRAAKSAVGKGAMEAIEAGGEQMLIKGFGVKGMMKVWRERGLLNAIAEQAGRYLKFGGRITAEEFGEEGAQTLVTESAKDYAIAREKFAAAHPGEAGLESYVSKEAWQTFAMLTTDSVDGKLKFTPGKVEALIETAFSMAESAPGIFVPSLPGAKLRQKAGNMYARFKAERAFKASGAENWGAYLAGMYFDENAAALSSRGYEWTDDATKAKARAKFVEDRGGQFARQAESATNAEGPNFDEGIAAYIGAELQAQQDMTALFGMQPEMKGAAAHTIRARVGECLEAARNAVKAGGGDAVTALMRSNGVNREIAEIAVAAVNLENEAMRISDAARYEQDLIDRGLGFFVTDERLAQRNERYVKGSLEDLGNGVYRYRENVGGTEKTVVLTYGESAFDEDEIARHGSKTSNAGKSYDANRRAGQKAWADMSKRERRDTIRRGAVGSFKGAGTLTIERDGKKETIAYDSLIRLANGKGLARAADVEQYEHERGHSVWNFAKVAGVLTEDDMRKIANAYGIDTTKPFADWEVELDEAVEYDFQGFMLGKTAPMAREVKGALGELSEKIRRAAANWVGEENEYRRDFKLDRDVFDPFSRGDVKTAMENLNRAGVKSVGEGGAIKAGEGNAARHELPVEPAPVEEQKSQARAAFTDAEWDAAYDDAERHFSQDITDVYFSDLKPEQKLEHFVGLYNAERAQERMWAARDEWEGAKPSVYSAWLADNIIERVGGKWELRDDFRPGADTEQRARWNRGSRFSVGVVTKEIAADEDFNNPSRDITLPKLPSKLDEIVGGDGRPVLLKKTILEKNLKNHPEISPEDSRQILDLALYHATLVGQSQPSKREHYWVAVNRGKGKNATVVVDVYPSKDNVEIVGWRNVNDRGLEKLKKQAEREDGQLLILSPDNGSAADLSALAFNLPSQDVISQDTDNSQPVTPAEDAAYADAVKRGDKETALRMIREAAAKAMPNTKVVDKDGLPKALSIALDEPRKDLRVHVLVSRGKMPEELAKIVAGWDEISTSPYSQSYYNSKDISWEHKPEGSLRVANHWNFESRGRIHCKTDVPVKSRSLDWDWRNYLNKNFKETQNYQWALGEYRNGVYHILRTWDVSETFGEYEANNDAIARQLSQAERMYLKEAAESLVGKKVKLGIKGMMEVDDDHPRAKTAKVVRLETDDSGFMECVIKVGKDEYKVSAAVVVNENDVDRITPTMSTLREGAVDSKVFADTSVGVIKSADVTYDDNGELIPLSQRFNRENPDVRFSIAPTTTVDPQWITPVNKVRDEGLKSSLVDSFNSNGWNGRPILAWNDDGNHWMAFTGSHRIEAAKEAGIEVPVYEIDHDTIEAGYNALENDGRSGDELISARDDYEREAVFSDMVDKYGIEGFRVPLQLLREEDSLGGVSNRFSIPGVYTGTAADEVDAIVESAGRKPQDRLDRGSNTFKTIASIEDAAAETKDYLDATRFNNATEDEVERMIEEWSHSKEAARLQWDAKQHDAIAEYCRRSIDAGKMDAKKTAAILKEHGFTQAEIVAAVGKAGTSRAAFDLDFDDTPNLIANVLGVRMAKDRALEPEKSLSRAEIESAVAKYMPEIPAEERGAMVDLIKKEAVDRMREVRDGIKGAGNDASFVQGMTRAEKRRYESLKRAAGRTGIEAGVDASKSKQTLEQRKEQQMADAVAAESGIDARAIETGLGIDLVESITKLYQEMDARVRKGEAEEEEEEKPGEGAGELAPTEEQVAAIKSLVESLRYKSYWSMKQKEDAKKAYTLLDDAIRMAEDGNVEGARKLLEDAAALGSRKAKKHLKYFDKFLADIKARTEQTDAADREEERETERKFKEEERDTGNGIPSAEELFAEAALEQNAVNLKNPMQLALFVEILARDNWNRRHGIQEAMIPWNDPVALKFLRSTAASIYSRMARGMMYQARRESAMEVVNKMRTAPTAESLQSLMRYAGEVIHAGLIRDTQKKLVKQLDRKLKIEFGAGGAWKQNKEETKRKVSGVTELWARAVRKVIWRSPEWVSNRIDELTAFIKGERQTYEGAGRDVEQSKLYAQAVRELSALNEFGALVYRSPGEIDDAMAKVDEVKDNDGNLAKIEERERRTVTAASLLAKCLDAGLTKMVDRSWFGKFLDRQLDFQNLLKGMMRFCKDDGVRDLGERIVDYLQAEIQDANDRAATAKRKHFLAFKDAVESIYGTSYHDAIAALLKEDDRFAEFGTNNNLGHRIGMNRAQAMQLLVSMQQRSYSKGMLDKNDDGTWRVNTARARRYQDGQDAKIRALLSEQDLALVAWLGKWYEQNRQSLSSVSMEVVGTPVMAEGENYFPAKIRQDMQGTEKPKVSLWNPFPGTLTARVSHNRDFDVEADIISMWADRMTEGEQWKAFAKIGVELRGIFGRNELQEVVATNHGKGAVDYVNEFITDILNGGGVDQVAADTRKAVDKIRGFTALFALGYNMGVMIKQTTSMPAFAFEIGFADTAKHIATAFTPEGWSAMKLIFDSEQRKNRWDSGNTDAVAAALADKNPSLFKRFLQGGMIFNKFGDVVPSLIVGQGIYRNAIRQGMTHDEAMNQVWIIVNRTQQTGQQDNLADLQRRSKWAALLYQFLSTQRQYLSYEINAWRNLAANPGKGEAWRKWGSVMLLNHLILPSLYYAGGELWQSLLGKPPDEDWMDTWVASCLTGPYASLFVFGMVGKTALDAFINGKHHAFSNNTMMPTEQMIKRNAAALGDVISVLWDRIGGDDEELNTDRLLKDADEVLKATNAGYRDIRKVIDNRFAEE